MKRKLTWIMALLLGDLLLAGCNPTVTPTTPPITRILSPTPTTPTFTPTPTLPPTVPAAFPIWVDDFSPQPLPGQAFFPFNRLDGNRGPLNDSTLIGGTGTLKTIVGSSKFWGGVGMSLNHPTHERLPIDFSAALPAQILPAYQSQINAITAQVADGTASKIFRLELKNDSELLWKGEAILSGGPQVVRFDLPALGKTDELVWVLDGAAEGDFVVLDSISLTATTHITDTATAAFVWSLAQLLENWNPTTGLVRDKAGEASGVDDTIQATGSLAAATAQAVQLGIIGREDATRIVSRISRTLLVDTPRSHGLLPNAVITSPTGRLTLAPGADFSSIDTAIAAIGLLAAQNALGLDTSRVEQLLRAVDWDDLTRANGMISMGYGPDGQRLGIYWDHFGGETWLVGLAYAGATGKVAAVGWPKPPTVNGSGFLDELPWVFVPTPSKPDLWGTDWTKYRNSAADEQIGYFRKDYPGSCFDQLGFFGLSAAWVSDPAKVPEGESPYQVYGVGGCSQPRNDGQDMMRAPVVAPHYAGLIASLRPRESVKMWGWLIQNGLATPLTNVESLMFPAASSCDASAVVWNHLKESWNLSLQTLGWGRYLAERRGLVPVLWQATTENPLLRAGYRLLAPNDPPPLPPTREPAVKPTPWSGMRDGEGPDESTVGQTCNSAWPIWIGLSWRGTWRHSKHRFSRRLLLQGVRARRKVYPPVDACSEILHAASGL